MAEWCGKRFALAFPYGRSGLFALFQVMGWRNREIILPAFSCAVVPNVILASGNIPRFVDVDMTDYNMRPELVAEALGSRTAAVIATHMYGFPMDLDGLDRVLSEHSEVAVIQDCALAPGARLGERPVWQTGLAALFSFSIGKHLSTVEGGVIVTDDENLHREMKDYRDRVFTPPPLRRELSQTIFFMAAWIGLTPALYGVVNALNTRTRALRFLTEYYDDEQVTVPSNLTERLPASLGALGASQVAKGDRLVARRTAISRTYRERLAEVAGLRWPEPRPGASFSHCPCLAEDREDFLSFMSRRGIQVGTEVFDYVLPDIPVFRPYADGDYENAREIVAKLALIPNHPRLRERQVDAIADAIERWAG